MADLNAPAAKAAPAAKPPARRGPGRPPKKAAPPPLEMKGIVAQPQSIENTSELVSGTPPFFKAIYSYFKRHGANIVQWVFAPTKLVMRAWNHEKTVRIIVTIPGEQMVHFYCEAVDKFELAHNNVEKVFNCIKASYEKITFVRSLETPEQVRILLKNSLIGKTADHAVAKNPFQSDESLDEAEEIASGLAPEKYALTFTLPFEDLKTTYESAKVHDSRIVIEKFGELPMRILYTKGGVAVQEVYQEPAKIFLTSRVGPAQMFQVEVPISNIAAVSLSKITDTVEIFCDAEKKDLAFRSTFAGISVVTLAPHSSQPLGQN